MEVKVFCVLISFFVLIFFLLVLDFLYWDPRFPVGTAPKKTTPFKEAIVFMVGGGNYLEYQNIRDYLARPNQQQSQASISPSLEKKIIYGSTEILTGSGTRLRKNEN